MTGLEAIWVPMVAGAVTGGGVAAAKGGDFGDIAKGAGIGAAGGAATGGLSMGLEGLSGAAPVATKEVATGALSGSNAGVNAQSLIPPPQAPQPLLASYSSTMNDAGGFLQPNQIQKLSDVMPQTQTQMPLPQGTPSYAATPKMQGSIEQQMQPKPQQPVADTKKAWTTADYINATSSAANLAANIAQSPETPRSPIAPMPAIFSGQGGDLMQQLSQLSQG